MKRVTFSNRTLLMGDDAADALVEYSALIARRDSADIVALRAVGADAEEIDATFMLGSGTILMAQSTHSTMEEPENSEAVIKLRQKISRLAASFPVVPQKSDDRGGYDDVGLY